MKQMEQKITVSDSELEILEVLWAADTALNANEIRSALNDHKNWERTTVLTLIQRLVKKGAVAQEKQALNNREIYYYAPCFAREEYVRTETKNFVEKFFKGRSKNLAAALVDSDALTKKDIEELRDYFNQNL